MKTKFPATVMVFGVASSEGHICHLTSLKSAWKSTPKCTWMCWRVWWSPGAIRWPVADPGCGSRTRRRPTSPKRPRLGFRRSATTLYAVSSILPIDRTLLGATTPGQSGPGSDGNEAVLRIPQNSSTAGTSLSDCLVSYLCRETVGVFYSPSRLGKVCCWNSFSNWWICNCYPETFHAHFMFRKNDAVPDRKSILLWVKHSFLRNRIKFSCNENKWSNTFSSKTYLDWFIS